MSKKLAAELLDERNWTQIWLASNAIVALAERDAKAAADYITRLHGLPESRQKATTIVMLRPALDRILAKCPSLTSADLTGTEQRPAPATTRRSRPRHDPETAARSFV